MHMSPSFLLNAVHSGITVPPFYSSFTEAAGKDYEMFEKQRDQDITNIMVKHVKSQIKLCKLVSSSLIVVLHQYKYTFLKRES